MFFIHPPYTAGKGRRAGRRLYKHSEIDHVALFDMVSRAAGLAVMTYDDCPEVVEMAYHHGFQIERIPMKNTHHENSLKSAHLQLCAVNLTARAAEDKYQFQWWASGQVGARPADQKKGADRGIDGRLYFRDDDSGRSKQIIFSVKMWWVTVSQVRLFARACFHERRRRLGCFSRFEPPTKPMIHEAAEAGLYKSSDGTTYARVQILSIEEILEGKQPEYPLHRRDATFKKAPRSRPAAAENLTLPLLPGDEV